MSVLYEIVSIVIGRWILGSIGFFMKKMYYFLIGSKYERKKVKSKSDDIIDMEEFSNRIIGLLTLFAAFIIADIFF
ncbi:hypothetical protein [Pedobacter nototheniae]|uniref:hypothetical protein n=1 Tax=Pedobacter nototheniae TaxID=2488994 RepID=UPI00103B968B|nr:hypothetical protein [Pedobacter nototheniae]